MVGEKKEKILRKRHSPISEAMNSGAGPDSLSNQKTIVLTYKRAAYPAPTARLSGAWGPGPGLYRVWGSRHSVPLLKEGHTAGSPAVATETRGWGGGWRPLAWLAAWAGEQGDVTAIGTPHGRFTWKPVWIKNSLTRAGPFHPGQETTIIRGNNYTTQPFICHLPSLGQPFSSLQS